MGLIQKSGLVGSGGLGKYGAGMGTGIAPLYMFYSKSDSVRTRSRKGMHGDMVAMSIRNKLDFACLVSVCNRFPLDSCASAGF